MEQLLTRGVELSNFSNQSGMLDNVLYLVVGAALAALASCISFVPGITFILLATWLAWVGQFVTFCFLYQKYFKREFFGAWFSCNTFMLEKLLGIEFRFYGDDIQDSGNDDNLSLTISNHHTELDWMFLWVFFGRLETLRTLKIVLKNQLKYIPIFGWIMQVSYHEYFLPALGVFWIQRPTGSFKYGTIRHRTHFTLYTLAAQIHIFVSQRNEG